MLASGEYQNARAAYDQILKAAPNDARAHLGRGMVEFELSKFDQAESEFRRATELDPSNVSA
ncbi:unnamed protein product, partial [Phaeothamnion confervicola]